MLEQTTIKKSLHNIYELIYCYKIALKELMNDEVEKTDYESIKQSYSLIEKKYLDFEISIYRNIEKKHFPFTQIFDLENETPYILDSLETEIFRNYIGLYNNGEKGKVEELSKTFNCSNAKIQSCIGKIIESFMDLSVQEQILNERNKLIKENIKNENLKKKVLNKKIEFFTITENLQEILKMNKIYTINDLIKMDYKKLEKINFENGYDSDLVIFPKRLINEVHDLGLQFEKLENTFKKMYESDKKLPNDFLEKLKEHTNKIETILDIKSIEQFEPEIIKTLDLNERIEVDTNSNVEYRQNKYADMLEESYKNIVDIVIKKNLMKQITPEQIIRKEFPDMIDEEVDFILGDCTELFEINTPTFEPKYKLRKTIFINKN